MTILPMRGVAHAAMVAAQEMERLQAECLRLQMQVDLDRMALLQASVRILELEREVEVLRRSKVK